MKKCLYSALVASLVLFSCSSDDQPDPEEENPEELITEVTLLLTNDADGEEIAIVYEDEDGIGNGVLGGSVVSNSALMANTRYTGSIELFNDIDDEDVTEEVDEESLDHQFFYFATGVNLDIGYDDVDADGNPIGLQFFLDTNEAGTGSLQVILEHEPNKDADGASEGDNSATEGEEDLNISIPITVVDPPMA